MKSFTELPPQKRHIVPRDLLRSKSFMPLSDSVKATGKAPFAYFKELDAYQQRQGEKQQHIDTLLSILHKFKYLHIDVYFDKN